MTKVTQRSMLSFDAHLSQVRSDHKNQQHISDQGLGMEIPFNHIPPLSMIEHACLIIFYISVCNLGVYRPT